MSSVPTSMLAINPNDCHGIATAPIGSKTVTAVGSMVGSSPSVEDRATMAVSWVLASLA